MSNVIRSRGENRRRRERVGSGCGGFSGTYLTKLINKHAAADAIFAVDDGTPLVWTCRHVDTGGKRRTFGSLLHGTMAGGLASALGLQKCQPGRQVLALCGDGGFAMLMGDLLTTVQENLPVKIAVYDNGKLGFVDIEQKAAGLVPVFTGPQESQLRRHGQGGGSVGMRGVQGGRARRGRQGMAR